MRDVPIEIDLDSMGKWKVDSPKVIDLFNEFGFKTLLNRVKTVGKQIDEEKQGALF